MEKSETFSIDSLTACKENRRLEVKSAKGGLPFSLWESYSAFANSDGGVIVLGVTEDKHGNLIIDGLDNPHKLLSDFWNTINNRQKVSSNILTDSMVSIEAIDGKEVIVINVPRAERTTRPVYVGADPRKGSYRRNHEGDYHCSLDEVSLMIRDSALVTDDNRLLTDIDVSVFCQETVQSYRNIFKLVRHNHLWNREDDAMFLRRIGAVRENKDTGTFHPTAAGLLMFGYEYDITTVFPNYFLDYQENRTNGIYARWTDRITSQSGDWSGNVFDFILKVIPKLQADLKVPFMFKGNYRNENTPLHKTVREATVNMLTNADFYGRRGIVVHKNADGFIFSNPGSMRVSLAEALQDSASDPRNGVMMKMLAMVEYGERAGSGLQGIFKTWQSVCHHDPVLEVTSSGGVDRTTLTLSFDGKQPDIEAMKQLYDEFESSDASKLRVNEKNLEYTPITTQKNAQSSPNSSPNSSPIVSSSSPIVSSSSPKSSPKKSPRTPKFTEESSDQKVLNLLKADSQLSLTKIASLLKMSKRGVQKVTNRLQQSGVLLRKGSARSGEWIVIGR